MPPYADHAPPANGFSPKSSIPGIITINVGGQLFQTTPQTLSLSGPKSFLSSQLSEDIAFPFIDRDPDLFSVLLSLLRTGYLPSKAKAFDLQDLISEAHFYNIHDLLVTSLSNPSHLDAFNLEKSSILPLNGRDSPSAIATTKYGSVHVAHGSKITSFDWSLRRKSTILTQFAAVDSLLSLSPSVAAAGATDFPGLQILDLNDGSIKQTLSWENPTRSSSTVQAIGASPDFLFTSFESSRRNSNSIMVFDLSAESSFQPIAEIGRGEIYGAELDSAIPATKLEWVPGYNLLLASGSHGGPSGLVGHMRLWDIRSSSAVWELKEKADCFADVAASERLNSIFKVGVNSGEVFMADMRKLSGSGSGNPWICIGGNGYAWKGGVGGRKEGSGCRIECCGAQVFCSKGGDVEMWSEVAVEPTLGCGWEEGVVEGRVFRRNVIGRVKDAGGCRITHMGFGGNRMVLARKGQQSVEVWQSHNSRV
ncbi:hypothetical protein ACLOJK_024446 [Asimina triloba]